MKSSEDTLRPALANIDEYRQYLRDITAIQMETVRRLFETEGLPPMEIAAVLEDIANKFLDVSDDIRELALLESEGQAISPEDAILH